MPGKSNAFLTPQKKKQETTAKKPELDADLRRLFVKLSRPIRVCSNVDLIAYLRSKATGLSSSLVFVGAVAECDCPNILVKAEDPKDVGLAIERQYYMKLIPELLRFTPHLIAPVRSPCEVRNFATLLPPRVARLWKNKQLPNSAALLFTEIARGSSLKSILLEQRPTWSRRHQDKFDRDVAIEMAYTLRVFSRFRFRHNDPHMENIICEIVAQPQDLGYKVQGKPFRSRVVLKLFDFDRATIESKTAGGLTPNPETSQKSYICARWGQCQPFVRNWDWYFFLARYIAAVEKSKTTTKLAQWTNFQRQSKQEESQSIGYPCLCKTKDCPRCSLDKKRLDALVSPSEFLRRVPL